MKRREFIVGSIALASACALQRLVAAEPARRRAAVVIGVDTVGQLPPLSAAKSGARQVAQWLEQEQFEVRLFVDDGKPVVVKDLFNAVSELVNRDLDQLLVYFAGHGFIRGYSEFWLLSGAPNNPNEAVSVLESVQLAQECPIPSVVFISDACRSTAQSLKAERVYGSLIFPNPDRMPNQLPEVDQFFATLVGDPAWEVPSAQSATAFAAIYTETFMDAFRQPDAAMVCQGPDGKSIVPNKRLKAYLAREVPKRAHSQNISIEQRPQTLVVSDDTIYIGHVMLVADDRPSTASAATMAAATAPSPPPKPARPTLPPVPTAVASAKSATMAKAWHGSPSVYDLANHALSSLGLSQRLSLFDSDELTVLDARTGFSKSRAIIAKRRELGWSVPIRSGILVSGTPLKEVFAGPGARVTRRKTSADGDEVALELDSGRRAAPVALEFADGTGTVVALLDNYCATVTVDAQGVSNVSYIPTKTSPFRSDYESQADRLLQMHAAVATAARFGAFTLEGNRQSRASEAEHLASEIRVLKAIDPTLGLYAAYAYAHAGLIDQIRSVRMYMRETLGLDLFDIAMLANTPGQVSRERVEPTPFCPLLAQGWNLLRVKQTRLPDPLNRARDYLRSSLWTTFDPEGMRLIRAFIQPPIAPVPGTPKAPIGAKATLPP